VLNISTNSINKDIDQTSWSGITRVTEQQTGKLIFKILSLMTVIFIITLFLPWTQHVRSTGTVSTLLPQQRPQDITSIIPGRIESWYIKEGDVVKRGDTILYLSEVKNEYFDPELLQRTRRQIDAKQATSKTYANKAAALSRQMNAQAIALEAKLNQARNKVQQARLYITSDSTNLIAKEINYNIAVDQYERLDKLYQKGLKSLTDLEKRQLTLQKAEADKISAANKLQSSRAHLRTTRAEIAAITAKYEETLAKTQSDQFSALSNQYDTDGTINKLEISYANYKERSKFQYIIAPQDGIVTKTIRSGIGEIIKEGEAVATIMPATYELAVEMYVKPIDLPLLQRGQKVRFQFDGWPAIIFAGWPNTSYGTFGGSIFAIDNFISKNGKYRVLVAQSKDDPWPEQLRVGSGANGLTLLQDVPIWYEAWRNINGFPPDFYKSNSKTDTKTK